MLSWMFLIMFGGWLLLLCTYKGVLLGFMNGLCTPVLKSIVMSRKSIMFFIYYDLIRWRQLDDMTWCDRIWIIWLAGKVWYMYEEDSLRCHCVIKFRQHCDRTETAVHQPSWPPIICINHYGLYLSWPPIIYINHHDLHLLCTSTIMIIHYVHQPSFPLSIMCINHHDHLYVHQPSLPPSIIYINHHGLHLSCTSTIMSSTYHVHQPSWPIMHISHHD